MRNLSRRKMLASAACMAAANLVPSIVRAAEPANFVDHPFKLGVASGDPLSDGFVIWTRLAPVPFDSLAAPQHPIKVGWQIAKDERFRKIVREGAVIAYPENAHAVHAEINGLEADREFYYRFHTGAEESAVGRAFTLPIVGSPTSRFRFAFACCQSLTDGHFGAYRDLVAQDPRLVIHTGDYIYEGDWVGGVRRVPVPEAFDLEGYRALYSRYKQDPALQAAHAAAPWLSIWDDHEVENDWGGDYSPAGLDPERFIKRKAAAFKAFFEHMPLRIAARPLGGEVRLYQRTVVGDLLQLDLLDCRQFRDRRACLDVKKTYRNYTDLCEEAKTSERTLLGREQERWFRRGFGKFGANWNALVQTTFMAPFDFLEGEGKAYDMDGWDGFTATRQRILDHIAKAGISNPVALGGNIHSYYAGVVNRIAADPESEALLSEIVATSISSQGGAEDRYLSTNAQFAENPFARYFDNRKRGYVLCDVQKDRWVNQFRTVENVMDPNSNSSTLATATIHDSVVDVNVS